MKAAELIAELGATRKQLAEWIKAGLPYTREGRARAFDPRKVSDWLLSRGFAKKVNVVATKAEVAKELGVNLRTVGTWLAGWLSGQPGSL